MRSSAALALALAGSAAAQFAGGLNYSTSGPLNVTASQIPQNTRNVWCSSQQIICNDLCNQDASANTCSTENLSWACKCAHGPTPNISSYTQTMPFELCTQWRINCVYNHPNDFTGQQNCLSVVCGNKTAPGPSTATSTSSTHASSSTHTTAAAKTSTTASTTTTPSSTKNLAAATNFASTYGTGLLAGGMLAAFGLAL